ncbi:GW dipeptide domain-containing protein [bacterium]|nr:GW dipeptide domain-containing protein [bacterium]
MTFQVLKVLLLPVIMLFIMACGSEPRVIEGKSTGQGITPNSIPSLENNATSKTPDSKERKVIVEDVLNTEKYSYLHVSEKGEKFWIAISNREVAVGETWYFRGGLLKKNFFSREFKRVFETVYLVSDIRKQPIGSGTGIDGAAETVTTPNQIPNLEVGKIESAPGAISLKELFSNKEKYENKIVKVTGKCVKTNPMIMNRNWLHIQDGSGEGLDLTVTTTENIPLGVIITMEGVLTLDKDFGAGYRYEVIMEEAVTIQ